MNTFSTQDTNNLPPALEYAGFWRRFAAALIDTVFLFIVLLLINVILFGETGLEISIIDGQLRVQNDNGFYQQIVVIIFTAFMWVKFLGTPGKLALGCHVIDDKTHKQIKPVQAIARYLSYLVSVIPLGLGIFWIAWDKKKQGFHDKLAGTIVVVDSSHLTQDESQKTVGQLMEELR